MGEYVSSYHDIYKYDFSMLSHFTQKSSYHSCASAIGELERRKRIFDGAPSADAYIKPEIEREVEEVPVRTEDELVEEVLREQARERGETVETDDDECDEEEEPEMTTKEILSSITKLRRALLSWGDICVRTAKMLARVQDEVGWEEIRSARQTTLESWFVGHAPKEVTTCDNL
jgi:hypothetical protein